MIIDWGPAMLHAREGSIDYRTDVSIVVLLWFQDAMTFDFEVLEGKVHP